MWHPRSYRITSLLPLQVFVETLDKCFENVCELDLIFHSDKVHYIVDEIVMGGMVLETNIADVLVRAARDCGGEALPAFKRRRRAE